MVSPFGVFVIGVTVSGIVTNGRNRTDDFDTQKYLMQNPLITNERNIEHYTTSADPIPLNEKIRTTPRQEAFSLFGEMRDLNEEERALYNEARGKDAILDGISFWD